jgi:hypothetical protein
METLHMKDAAKHIEPMLRLRYVRNCMPAGKDRRKLENWIVHYYTLQGENGNRIRRKVMHLFDLLEA